MKRPMSLNQLVIAQATNSFQRVNVLRNTTLAKLYYYKSRSSPAAGL